MRIGSLCSGYGGLDHAVEEVFGATTAWVSDVDKGACKILAHRYPDVPNIGDMTTVDWASVEPVDIVTAGYPCQPFSHAGRRKGTTDVRHLWPYVREAIRVLRPRLTVLENVAGHRSLGFDRVLGDLAEDGMHVRWTSLRAADIGAPHGRERLFIVVTPDARGSGGDQALEHDGGYAPRVNGAGVPDEPDRDALRTGPQRTLLPTPRATDGTKGGPNQRGSSGDLMLPSAVALLPTPAVNDMGDRPWAREPGAWDAWVNEQRAKGINGNGHGKSLAIEAQRLTNREGTDEGLRDSSTGQDVRGVRDDVQPEAVQRDAGEHEPLPDAPILLAELREYEADSDQGCAALAGTEVQGFDLSGLRDDRASARSPRGPQPGEQRSGEPDDALRELSSQVALARGPRCPYGCGQACAGHSPEAWGDYEAAIRRWEVCLGRPAPAPTRLSAKGNPQLAADFCEFLMGLPAGWVTDVPGITRNEALKALGNGVVAAQAAAALRLMLAWEMAS